MQSLMPWRRAALRFPADPFQILDQLHGDLGRVFHGEAATAALSTPIDVTDREGELRVRAEVPGVDPDKLDIQLTGDVLSIRGEKTEESETKEGARTWSERRYGSFARSVQLPCAVDAESVKAEHKHGVVTITLRKADAVRTRRISIQSS
jgi:HSP20 family protein